MLALTQPLKARLQGLPALTGWAVRTGTDAVDRRPVPAAVLRCSGAQVADRRVTACMVEPQWTVTLVVQRGPQASDLLDAAFAEVVASLHNWHSGTHGGRSWEPLRLALVSEPAFADEGMAGLDLTFTTSGLYHGQD